MQTVMAQAEGLDFLDAVRSVVSSCSERLQGGRPAAGIFFTSFLDAEHADGLGRIADAFGDFPLIGCSTDGEMSSDFGYSERSCALLLFVSETVRFAAALVEDFAESPEASARVAVEAASKALAAEPKLCFALPDGLSTIGMSVDKALRSALGEAFPILGGAAGDRMEFSRTYQFCGRRSVSGGMALLLMAGPLHLASGMGLGWKPQGRSFTLTGTQGNTVYSIDHHPALSVLAQYLGPDRSQYSYFPLAVQEAGQGYYLRNPISCDEREQSVSFVGNVPAGATVRFTEAGSEDILEAAREATREARSAYGPGQPALALVVSCCSRRRALGTRTAEELAPLVRAGVPFFGFYSYGELAPAQNGGAAQFHNKTFVVLFLGREERS